MVRSVVQREATGQDVAFKAFDIAAAPRPRPRRGGPYVPEGLCPTGRALAPAGPNCLGLAFARRVGWIPRVPTFYGCESSRVAELLGLMFRIPEKDIELADVGPTSGPTRRLSHLVQDGELGLVAAGAGHLEVLRDQPLVLAALAPQRALLAVARGRQVPSRGRVRHQVPISTE